ncbi:hypothetical protein J6590_026139, partial [Homalodisca vitripennis]
MCVSKDKANDGKVNTGANNNNFINLSTNVLDKAGILVSSIIASDFLTGIESDIAQLSEEQGDLFRCKTSLLFRKFPLKPQFDNVGDRFMNILGKLDTIKILPADKGNANNGPYLVACREKVVETLNTRKYTVSNKDPTDFLSTWSRHKGVPLLPVLSGEAGTELASPSS